MQNRPNGPDLWWLTDYILVTMRIVNPIIDAFNMEGYYHFKPPCSLDSRLSPPNCTQGSNWTPIAQSIMGLGYATHLVSSDTFQSSDHFASLNNNCSTGTPCVLNISTITGNIYSNLDNFDTGLQPVAAIEARTKMISRQAILEAFYLKPFDFNQTDTIDLCASINQESIKYALNNSALATLNRYLAKGKQLKVGSDIGPMNSGEQWITTSLVSLHF